MKIRSQNKFRKIEEIKAGSEIYYLVNHEESILSITPLEDDISIKINTDFAFFGDTLKINLVSLFPQENKRVKFIGGVSSPDISIGKSVFLEFQFDGKYFLPIGGASSDLRIGSIINEGRIGALMYTDKSNLLKQDVDYLYFNDKKKFLYIGHDNPTSNIDVVGNRKQIKISSSSPKTPESSIEFGIYGQESRWILGGFGEDLNDFCLKDNKTGDIFKLNLTKIENKKKEK